MILYPKHTVHRELPVNLQASDRSLFEHELSRDLPDMFHDTIKNALILKDAIFDRSRLRFLDLATHVRPLDAKQKAARLAMLSGKSQSLEHAVWAIDQWSRGYFHWFSDAMPRLLAIQDKFKDVPVLIPEPWKSVGYITRSLELIDRPAHYFAVDQRLKVKALELVSHAAPTGNYNEELMTQMRNALRVQNENEPTRKIYISRERAEKRKFGNEAELRAVFEQAGFETVYMEDLSFDAQRELMAETRVLAGIHGAGLTNMIFMPAGGKVLEIRNAGDAHNNCYFALTNALQHHYYYLLAQGDQRDTHRVTLKLNPEELKRTIADL